MRLPRPLFCFCSLLYACGPKEEDPPLPYKPFQAGTGGAIASNPSDSGAPPSDACVTFSFTTLDNHGRYSPRNVSAVWVMTASGTFVRTLEENGYIRQSHLNRWIAETGGNRVDAITGATNPAPGEHTSLWDCTGLDQQPVPDGSYLMHAEFTTSNTGGLFGGQAPFLEVPFDLGGGPGTINPPDEQYFVGITLTHQR
jgi:hypothetical protein